MPAACRAAAAALAVALSPFGVGCGFGAEHEPYVQQPVWSDTDESWLVVRGTERIERCGVDWDCEPRTEKVNHELWIHPVDGGEPRQLLGRRKGAARYLHFMESAGYVLLLHQQEWERIGLDGEVRDVRPREPPFEKHFFFLPSPDGAILAKTRQTDCTPPNNATECTYEVSFVDAHTLEPTGGSATHRLRASGGFNGPTWGPEGRLYVTSDLEAFRVGVDGRKHAGLEPVFCRHATSSERVSSDGQDADARLVDGQVEVTVDEPSGPGWPERCFSAAE